jgi:di/tricarboxylate transporter
MELTVYHLLLAFVINRIVEVIKQALPPANEESPTRLDRWRTFVILIMSFVIGAIVMLAVFPAYNLFPDAASAAAGLVFTGILVGGMANGWDLAGKLGEALVLRTESKATGIVNFQASVAADERKAA